MLSFLRYVMWFIQFIQFTDSHNLLADKSAEKFPWSINRPDGKTKKGIIKFERNFS